MGIALYRKYRSKKLDEIVGQEHITQTLSNALAKGAISHAYLFTGPRGVGKTSIARILAHEVNELPYQSDQPHLDIIEIDAASNRRIDEVRDLRERVHVAPASARYKVYIIDEVHMLTKEAFNALLKTLEEPPAHVIFILATTEAHKLPETIVSRTQRFSFKPIAEKQAVRHLADIAKQEGIKISDDALRLLVQHAGGSFRDSISMLDQAANISGQITLADVEHILGIAPENLIDMVMQALDQASPKAVMAALEPIREQGYRAPQIAKQVAARLRQQLLDDTAVLPPDALTGLLEALLAVPASHDSETALELALIGAVVKKPKSKGAPASPPVQQRPPDPPKDSPARRKPSVKALAAATVEEPVMVAIPDQPAAETANPSRQELDQQTWKAILLAVKERHNTLYGVVRMAVPRQDGNNLTLAFGFPFHYKRINEAKNRQVIAEIVKQHLGKEIDLLCVIEKSAADTAAPSSSQLDTISNIFGGAEVIES